MIFNYENIFFIKERTPRNINFDLDKSVFIFQCVNIYVSECLLMEKVLFFGKKV